MSSPSDSFFGPQPTNTFGPQSPSTQQSSGVPIVFPSIIIMFIFACIAAICRKAASKMNGSVTAKHQSNPQLSTDIQPNPQLSTDIYQAPPPAYSHDTHHHSVYIDSSPPSISQGYFDSSPPATVDCSSPSSPTV
ncbi:hypothetical protein BC833DRAFT_562802 [Globomyces pollinis-pini]|nr:hypothetical protein BC833DRAFT_562802 [Globomyces pollinis-pini]